MHVLDMPRVLGVITREGQRLGYTKGMSRGLAQLFQTIFGVEVGDRGGHEVAFLIGQVDEQWDRDAETELQQAEWLSGSHWITVGVDFYASWSKGCVSTRIPRQKPVDC